MEQLTNHLQARASASADPQYWHDHWQRLAIEAREKALRYELWIEADQLDEGMVVSRRSDGKLMGECDSLLFSSLRYTALVKLGWQDKARRAWQGISRAFHNGRWTRHPKCKNQYTSRDMIIGLLAAMTQNPPAEVRHLQQLLRIVKETGGSIDEGPFYVSRLSPELGEIMRLLSMQYGVPLRDLPVEVRLGFSTLEIDTWTATPGFTSHLNALTLWIEWELLQRRPQSSINNLSELLDKTLGRLGSPRFEDQRLQWLGQKLAELDPKNLFFQWLKYRTSQALTWKTQSELLQELLSMKQFPDTHLPRSCDRDADYMWQRASREYGSNPNHDCEETFPGVDFLWMVALLTENL